MKSSKKERSLIEVLLDRLRERYGINVEFDPKYDLIYVKENDQQQSSINDNAILD